MNYEKFISQLPTKYDNWTSELVTPKSDDFKSILTKIEGMTTPNVLQLINLAVECMSDDEVYCEIGTYQGSTLIGALINNPHKMAYAVDDFSEFDLNGENFNKLENNLSFFNLEEQVIFCNQDFEEFFFDLKNSQINNKIGVYFYDGSHDYRSQLMGLLLAVPFLANQALIIVDDTNFMSAKQANYDFLALNPHCELILDLPTPQNFHCTYWNGIQVFSFDRLKNISYNWYDFSQKFRNNNFLQNIYDSFLKFEGIK
jgi:hypothetical protein